MRRFLTFLRLIDEDGLLSLSHIAVIVTIVKLAMSPTVSVADSGMFLIAMMNYAYKRHVNNGVDVTEEVSNSVSKVTQLQTDLQKQVDSLGGFLTSVDELKTKVSRLGITLGVAGAYKNLGDKAED